MSVDNRPLDTRAEAASTHPDAKVERKETILALRICKVEIGGDGYFRRLLLERVAINYLHYWPVKSDEEDEELRVKHLDILLDRPLAVLTWFWCASDYVSDAELKAAGLKREKSRINRASLGRYLQDEGKKVGEEEYTATYEARGRRVIEAMLSFGLLEEKTREGKSIPLRGTELLHGLMSAYFESLAYDWLEAVDGKPRSRQGKEG